MIDPEFTCLRIFSIFVAVQVVVRHNCRIHLGAHWVACIGDCGGICSAGCCTGDLCPIYRNTTLMSISTGTLFADNAVDT